MLNKFLDELNRRIMSFAIRIEIFNLKNKVTAEVKRHKRTMNALSLLPGARNIGDLPDQSNRIWASDGFREKCERIDHDNIMASLLMEIEAKKKELALYQ